MVECSVPFFGLPLLDRSSQGRVRTKSWSFYNCQSTPVVIVWSVTSYGLWGDYFPSRWVVQVPYLAYRFRSRVSPIYTLQYLFFLCTWRRLWCAPYSVLLGVMTDDIIHRDPSPVENLNNQDLVRYVSSFASYDYTNSVRESSDTYYSGALYSMWICFVPFIAIVVFVAIYLIFLSLCVSNIYSVVTFLNVLLLRRVCRISIIFPFLLLLFFYSWFKFFCILECDVIMFFVFAFVSIDTDASNVMRRDCACMGKLYAYVMDTRYSMSYTGRRFPVMFSRSWTKCKTCKRCNCVIKWSLV